MNLKQAARLLGIHYQTAYKLVRSGRLAAVRVGGGYEISDAAIACYLAERAAIRRPPRTTEAPVADSPEAVIDDLETVVRTPCPSARPALEMIADALANRLGDLAVVCSCNETRAELVPGVVRHRNARRRAIVSAAITQLPIPVGSLRTGSAMAKGESALIPHVPQDVVRSRLPKSVLQYLDDGGIHSLIAVPVWTQRRITGALLVTRDAPGAPYSRDDLALVERFARLAGTALDRARLAKMATQRREQLLHRLALDGTIDSTGEQPELAEVICDASARVVAVNDAAVEIARTSRANLLGRNLVDLVAREEREDEAQVVKRLLIGELPYIDVVRHTACVDTQVPVAAHHGVARRHAAEPRALVVVAYEHVDT